MTASSFAALKTGNSPDPQTSCHCEEPHNHTDGSLWSVGSYSAPLELMYQNIDLSEISLHVVLFLHLENKTF